MKPASILRGTGFGLWYTRDRIFHSYVLVPIGVIVILCVLYGFNQLLANVANIKFPASVLGMLVNLVWLTSLSLLSNTSQPLVRQVSGYTLEKYLMIVKPSMNFCLKWINVFFIPSFVILPLSEHISFIECLKIAGVFVGGFIITFIFDAYFVMGLRWAIRRFIGAKEKREEEEEEELNQLKPVNRADITTIDLSSIRSVQPDSEQTIPEQENPFRTPSMMSQISAPKPTYAGSGVLSEPRQTSTESTPDDTPNETEEVESSEEEEDDDEMSHLDDDAKQVAVWVSTYLDWLVYAVLFIVSLPLYYIKSVHTFLPYHIAITVLAFNMALLIPQKWPVSKKFAHPIIVSTGIILFVCFIGSLIYHHHPKGFLEDLRYYKTGKNYRNLFSGKIMVNGGKENSMPVDDPTGTPQWPGCGDFLSSLMDVSIVALSLPMFTHRRDFVHNFVFIMPSILATSVLTFFIYPLFCYHIGISPERSLGFVGRSVTLALGTPLVIALGGSVSLMAVCTILSGICGVLIGDQFFKLLRVPKDDYATRGVSMGINCGAISTAHLLTTDPRAASMSSLSFSVFGTVMVVLASINGVAAVIRGWVGF